MCILRVGLVCPRFLSVSVDTHWCKLSGEVLLETKEARGEFPRTVVREEMAGAERFARSQHLDRPFLSQSPGYATQGELRKDLDSILGVEEINLRHKAKRVDVDVASPSVDDIVAMLATKERNRHYKTGGRPGVFVEHARKVKQRIAGAPLK